MKMIFKIEEYLPDTKQVVIRYCRQNAPKPISEYPAKAVSTDNYDTSFDSRNLLESIAQYGYTKVLAQEDKEEILPENIPADVPNSLDIADYVAGMNKLIGEELMNIEVPMQTFETPRIYSGPVEVQGASQDQDTVFAAQILNSLTKANAGGVRPSLDGDYKSQVPAAAGEMDVTKLKTEIRRNEMK